MQIMRVLWITNILFPEVIGKLSGENELKASGGWMLGAAKALSEKPEISLYVATVSSLVKELIRVDGEKIRYYIIPYGKGNLRENSEYQKFWTQIKDEVSPDIVHIHGTEFSHGHAYMKACGSDNVVISIQGMKSAYSCYYYYGMSKCDVYKNVTFRDVLRGTIFKEQRDFRSSSSYEIDMLKMSKHIIGRTSWDRARTWAINPDAQYHFCNETLRENFYDGSLWNYEKCCKRTIFMSQAGYPIKGLHQLLKAMPLILLRYPDTKIRIAGTDITKCMTFKDFIHFTGYGLYVKRLIKRYGLKDKVCFVGNLNAEGMKQEYMNCNVFLCPSSIENSPNSLGEAQILGVPCVASYVGGVPDMMAGNEENLYRFEEIEMLAAKISRVFDQRDSQSSMVSIAMERHDRQNNAQCLIGIYSKIKKNT